MKGLFDAHRDAELTLEELAAASSRLSKKLKLQPDDRRIGPLNERTIRFYQGRGLLEPPRRTGRQALYSLLHLLQVLTLRRLQAQGYTLDGIKGLVDSGELPWQSISSLERAIVLADRAAAGSPDKRAPQLAHRARRTERAFAFDAMSASVVGSPSHEDWRAIEEDILRRLERRVEETTARRLHDALDSLMPRIEAALEELLERKLTREWTSREVRPGVRVLIDPSRVSDPDEVLSRIEQAVSDEC